jgi:hypothetical protein
MVVVVVVVVVVEISLTPCHTRMPCVGAAGGVVHVSSQLMMGRGEWSRLQPLVHHAQIVALPYVH